MSWVRDIAQGSGSGLRVQVLGFMGLGFRILLKGPGDLVSRI